jgi:murein DD-endopeptidase MepM/ murein hydrolase activator NlpD
LRCAIVVCLVALGCAAPAAAHTSDARQLAFQWPAQGTVTSPFGWDGPRWHPGVDIGILRSPDVRAAAPGVVRRVGWLQGYEGYGNLVLVDVGAPYETLYAHLSRARVEVGAYVSAGDLLGVAGCTGWCTGTHLHFELRRAGVPVDPTELFVG